MTKSSLVGLIHHKIMNSPSVSYDNGEATTLMSTDADSLDCVAEMVHETWAQIIEVLIGIGLLASQVGWVWPLPLVLIYCKCLYPITLWIDLKIYSVFTHESICCKEPTARAKGLEQYNTESHSCHELNAEFNENRQVAWNATQSYESHSGSSE